MENPKPYPRSNPMLFASSFVHHHCTRLGAELSNRLEEAKRFAGTFARRWPAEANWRSFPTPPFASLAQHTNALAATLSSDQVAKSLVGTAVYTVSNSNNEFVLISDPNGVKSIGLLCFRMEDAETFLAQVRSRKRELRSNAKVVPLTLDQLKASDSKSSFDGVPVFQSDLLIVKKKNKRYCPIYFTKEDIEKELSKVSKASRGLGTSQHIMVGSLEDVLKKMELNEKNSAWEDLIFIPPGKSHSQHIQEVGKA
ncbi:protein TIC 22, chloroplastic isoform X2 [Cucurbita maxima]|uniref:Protein TIC 22, chloroplastic isoform X2 n=1 Tax=Cucurbita maxima TaxID=3661 RepID=A0A6J1J433_CUCMA|nr:protein TIC 22, chloroplastic isoform X2 [Cucurbita maxima]